MDIESKITALSAAGIVMNLMLTFMSAYFEYRICKLQRELLKAQDEIQILKTRELLRLLDKPN